MNLLVLFIQKFWSKYLAAPESHLSDSQSERSFGALEKVTTINLTQGEFLNFNSYALGLDS